MLYVRECVCGVCQCVSSLYQIERNEHVTVMRVFIRVDMALKSNIEH